MVYFHCLKIYAFHNSSNSSQIDKPGFVTAFECPNARSHTNGDLNQDDITDFNDMRKSVDGLKLENDSGRTVHYPSSLIYALTGSKPSENSDIAGQSDFGKCVYC